MEKPVILAVDDEPAVLAAIARDLRRQYGSDYRIVRADSGAAALDSLRQLKLRGEPVALLLSDQRMPVMSGVELLEPFTPPGEAARYEEVLLNGNAQANSARL